MDPVESPEWGGGAASPAAGLSWLLFKLMVPNMEGLALYLMYGGGCVALDKWEI